MKLEEGQGEQDKEFVLDMAGHCKCITWPGWRER